MEKYSKFLDSQLRNDYYLLLKQTEELEKKLTD